MKTSSFSLLVIFLLISLTLILDVAHLTTVQFVLVDHPSDVPSGNSSLSTSSKPVIRSRRTNNSKFESKASRTVIQLARLHSTFDHDLPTSQPYQLRLVHLFGSANRSLAIRVTQLTNSTLLPSDRFGVKIFPKDSLGFSWIHFTNASETRVFANEDNSTLLLVSKSSKDGHQIYGLINDQLMITPVFSQAQLHSYGFKNHTLEKSLHAIFELANPVSSKMGFEVRHLLRQLKKTPFTLGDANYPDLEVYPEVTLVVDESTFRLHGNDPSRLWRYFVIYFHRMDLLYKELGKPRIQIRLKQIMIRSEPFAFQRDPVRFRSRNMTHALHAINELGYFFYRHRVMTDLTLMVTATELCLHSNRTIWNECQYATVKGQSFVGGACRQNHNKDKEVNVAIVEDHGEWDSVRVAAHELGHLLGSVHDGDWPLGGILGPGGRGCTTGNKAFMMTGASAARTTEVYWSRCSREQFYHFLRQPESYCLFNRP